MAVTGRPPLGACENCGAHHSVPAAGGRRRCTRCDGVWQPERVATDGGEAFVPDGEAENDLPRSLVGRTRADALDATQVKSRCGRCGDVVSRDARERCGGCE